MTRMVRLALVLLSSGVSLLCGCTHISTSTDHRQMSQSLLWYRTSANQKSLYTQAFTLARLQVAARLAESPSAWGVVVDIDETVLDNSDYQMGLFQTGESYTERSWNDWVSRGEAVAFAPARDFIAWIRGQGGRVIAVTNRSESQCPITRRNLESQGVSVDGLLCAPDGVLMPEKETRFSVIENGTALPGVGALQVLLYIGDQVTDCRGQSENNYDVTLFGTRCVALPNPLYGTWGQNPLR